MGGRHFGRVLQLFRPLLRSDSVGLGDGGDGRYVILADEFICSLAVPQYSLRDFGERVRRVIEKPYFYYSRKAAVSSRDIVGGSVLVGYLYEIDYLWRTLSLLRNNDGRDAVIIRAGRELQIGGYGHLYGRQSREEHEFLLTGKVRRSLVAFLRYTGDSGQFCLRDRGGGMVIQNRDGEYFYVRSS